mmetsp:Transcript_85602/g.178838  ORF Transcript_85602/g.178838 Transcript_85602/m.178838 type:complete len:323 (-) Transcript_85602:159-1127(-)
MKIADIDEGPGVRQLGVLQKVLDGLGIVVGGLPAHSLHLLHVTTSAGSLDVLVVDLSLGAGGQNGTQEVENALVGTELLEHGDQLARADLAMVLDRNLDDHLKVLAVVPQEIREALQGRLRRHSGEVLDEEFGGHVVCLHQSTLDVGRVGVILHGVLDQSRLLAEATNVGAVVVRQHVHLEDGLGNLGRLLQVHRQQLRLELGLVGPVVLQSLQENRGGLLQPVLLHEDLHNLVKVDERHTTRALQQTLGEICGALGVRQEETLQQVRVVSLVANFLDVSDDLIDLTQFDEALNDLSVGVGADENREGESAIHRLDHISELL